MVGVVGVMVGVCYFVGDVMLIVVVVVVGDVSIDDTLLAVGLFSLLTVVVGGLYSSGYCI